MKIHIERLTVESSSPLAADQLVAALRAHLSAGAASGGPFRPSTINRIDAGRINQGAGMDRAGRQIANGIFDRVKGGRRG